MEDLALAIDPLLSPVTTLAELVPKGLGPRLKLPELADQAMASVAHAAAEEIWNAAQSQSGSERPPNVAPPLREILNQPVFHLAAPAVDVAFALFDADAALLEVEGYRDMHRYLSFTLGELAIKAAATVELSPNQRAKLAIPALGWHGDLLAMATFALEFSPPNDVSRAAAHSGAWTAAPIRACTAVADWTARVCPTPSNKEAKWKFWPSGGPLQELALAAARRALADVQARRPGNVAAPLVRAWEMAATALTESATDANFLDLLERLRHAGEQATNGLLSRRDSRTLASGLPATAQAMEESHAAVVYSGLQSRTAADRPASSGALQEYLERVRETMLAKWKARRNDAGSEPNGLGGGGSQTASGATVGRDPPAAAPLPKEGGTSDSPTVEPPKPRWDAVTRTLSFCGKVCKKLKAHANTQRKLLGEMEKAGWPPELEGTMLKGVNADTCKDLNKRLLHIVFGSGNLRLWWKPRPEASE